MDEPITHRYCAQPGGVEVAAGESEIVVTFPEADQYGDLGERKTVAVELDSATARHLAELLLAVTPTEEQEVEEALRAAQVTLSPSGRAPLTFRGWPIAAASSRVRGTSGPLENRWHDLTIYRTAPRGGGRGRYVLSIGYQATWKGELDRRVVHVLDSPQEVCRALEDHDPLTHVGGYPASEPYAERQARLLALLRGGWDQAVAQLLAAAGPEFAVAIE